LKTPYSEEAANGGWPSPATIAGIVTTGKYVSGITAGSGIATSSVGILTATYKAAPNANAKVAGKTVVFELSVSGVWMCGSDLAAEVKPKSCSGTSATPSI
jgi:hypothetical protein